MAVYSTFLQRAYDQIIHDIALQQLPVVLCFDRAGLVGEDGATHQGAFDIAAYRSIPGTVICAPKDEWELRQLMYTGLQQDRGPFIIRYPRGMGEGALWEGASFVQLPVGKAETMIEGSDIAVVGTGPALNRAVEAAECFGGKVGVYNFRYVKPLDTEALEAIARKYRRIVTVEDGAVAGGLFGAVSEYLGSHGFAVPVEPVGIGDVFVAQASQKEQRSEWKLDKEGLEKIFQKCLEI